MTTSRIIRGLEALTTEQIVVIHERIFGRLEPVAKQRIIQTARMHGWDRDWSDDLAA